MELPISYGLCSTVLISNFFLDLPSGNFSYMYLNCTLILYINICALNCSYFSAFVIFL